MIPTLETGRLVLRPPVFAEFAAYARLMASERAVYMDGPFDTRQAWGMFCAATAQWHLFGHGCLMIERREDGLCIGQVGINHGPSFPERELGWLLYDGFERHGYATKAATAMRDWAWRQDYPTLVSYCDPDNAASIAVTQRLGGIRDDSAARPDPDDLVFRYWG